MTREAKVGALVVAAMAALAVSIFLVGERNNLFARTNEYFINFENVGGLASGNPVQLSGVTVGRVERVVLPQAVDQEFLTVWISLDSTYEERIREDSVARIKTLGLLGDKYIEISSGSADSRVVAVSGEIKAAAPTDVDRLLTSGEDAVDNVVAISYSLRSILDRVNAGEGLLGELLMASESGEKVKTSVVDTLSNFETISGRVASGDGTLGRLIANDELAIRLEGAIGRLETRDEGGRPGNARQPEGRRRRRRADGDSVPRQPGAAAALPHRRGVCRPGHPRSQAIDRESQAGLREARPRRGFGRSDPQRPPALPSHERHRGRHR
jgi:phospholipid/cholesterol/gamma-HCH transport system substrate-binding protein